MDFLRFTALEIGLHPSVVGDTVEFMGRNKKFIVEDFYFEPLEGVWDVLFDSLERDFSTPEVFNIPIEKFLMEKIIMRNFTILLTMSFFISIDIHAGCLDGFKEAIQKYINKRNHEKLNI